MIRWMIRDAPGRRKATEEAANDKLPVAPVKLIRFILWVQLILCGALDAATAAPSAYGVNRCLWEGR